MRWRYLPDIPSLAIGMLLILVIALLFKPSAEVLQLLSFAVIAVVAEVTFRRTDRGQRR